MCASVIVSVPLASTRVAPLFSLIRSLYRPVLSIGSSYGGFGGLSVGFIVVSLACVVWLGGLFDLGDFAGLEAECFVESYEHEWCAFVGFFGSG